MLIPLGDAEAVTAAVVGPKAATLARLRRAGLSVGSWPRGVGLGAGELGGSTSHLAALARERGIPAVRGVPGATRRIPEGGAVPSGLDVHGGDALRFGGCPP